MKLDIKMKTNLITVMLLLITIVSFSQTKSKLPFVGKRSFNFMGGNGTGEIIQINLDGSCIIYYDGGPHGKEELIFKGKYSTKIMAYRKKDNGVLEFVSGYRIVGNKIFLLNKNGKQEKECKERDQVCWSSLDRF